MHSRSTYDRSMARASFFIPLCLTFAALPLAAQGCFFFGAGSDHCECPTDLGPCELATCEDDDCVVTYNWGTPDELQTYGDCQAVACVGQTQPIELFDEDDVPDDGNACTVETCTEDGPVQERLPFGSSCEGTGVCAAEVVCVSCAGEPCWNVDCAPNPPIIEPLAAGASCGNNQFCDGNGGCFECDDGNSCTVEDCSSGTLAVVETFAPGTECDNGGYCNTNGVCVPCDDYNECTSDDCTGGVETFTPLPLGTPCGNNNSCENGVCITWCTPLPDLATCPDSSAYEATDDEQMGEPQFVEDDNAPKPICGVLTAGDEDWISYYAEDESFETDINDFQFWSFSKNLRFCAFAECAGGPSNTSAPCENGGTPSTSPTGYPGCCWQGTFNTLDYFSMNLECLNSDSDSGWVRIRIDNPSDDECAPYGLLDYGY